MTDIATWLGQQLDEDERFVRAVTEGTGSWTEAAWVSCNSFVAFASFSDDDKCVAAQAFPLEPLAPVGASIADHIARHDPAHVLRDIAAKRRILARHCLEHGGSAVWCAGCGESDGGYPRSMGEDRCPELRDMASGYADRPGYKDEWRP